MQQVILKEEMAKRTAVGEAWVVEPATNAKLKVQFFWPFRGDYWVLGLDDGTLVAECRYGVGNGPRRGDDVLDDEDAIG